MITLFFFISYMLIVAHMLMDNDRYICDSWYCPLSILCSVVSACGATFVGFPIDFIALYPGINLNVVYAVSGCLFTGALVNWFVLFVAWRYRATGKTTLFARLKNPSSVSVGYHTM